MIPPNETTGADIAAWYDASKKLQAAKANEMLLRMKVFNGMFTAPIEGTNTIKLPDVNGLHYALKAVYPINRKIDEALLIVNTPMFHEKKISVDTLVKRTPELVIGEYRKLTAEEMKLFDSVMEIKPGTPSLKIEQVKK
jgi:hypothetical protein